MKRQQCRSCGADVIWAVTPKGKRIPLDAKPNVRGNVVISEERAIVNGHEEIRLMAHQVAPLIDVGQTRYMPHHASCPQGRQWRR